MTVRDATGRRRERDSAGSEARSDAWDAAVKYLAIRARTSHEVRQRLVRRGYALDDIAAVMTRLTAARYVDDADFARAWVVARAHRKTAAPSRLTRELRAKGIPDGLIAAALRTLEEEWNAGAAASEAARRKMKSLGGLPVAVARRRLAGYLERRGFERDVILATCRRYLAEGEDGE